MICHISYVKHFFCEYIQAMIFKQLEIRAHWSPVRGGLGLSPPAFWKLRPSLVRTRSWGGQRRTIRRPIPFFFMRFR